MKVEKHGIVSYKGIMADMLDQIANNLQIKYPCTDYYKSFSHIIFLSYSIRPSYDGTYGGLNSNGTWSGLVGQLVNDVI